MGILGLLYIHAAVHRSMDAAQYQTHVTIAVEAHLNASATVVPVFRLIITDITTQKNRLPQKW